jgi:excisionase family DNA binding protein
MTQTLFTQLSIPELQQLLREVIEESFAGQFPKAAGQEKAGSFLTVPQAAEFLNLSTSTVYGLVSRREIPNFKRGKHLYFSNTELEEWVKQGRRKTTSEIQVEAVSMIKPKGKRA